MLTAAVVSLLLRGCLTALVEPSCATFTVSADVRVAHRCRLVAP